ncbi:MAG: hypothetical protein E7538_05795 [Ruminococcaceae bacterium]|nr:hypothetical protein [Oscillospiraceae bacterium]
MITANDVLTVLRSNYDTADCSESELLSFCEIGLRFVNENLRTGVSPDNPLITETAAAVAHYQFFVRTASATDKCESYRAGDISVNNSPLKALERESRIRDEALARAHSILQDGGFGCYAQ